MLTIAVSAVFGLLAIQDAPPAPQPKRTTDVVAPLSRRDVVSKSPRFWRKGVSYIELHVPFPIQKAEIGRWQRILQLSDAQSLALDQLHDQYWERYTAYGNDKLVPLWDESATVAACDGTQPPVICADLHKTLFEHRDKALAGIVSIDDALISALSEMLGEHQASVLQRIRNDRIRSRVRFLPHDHPAAGIDHTLVLEELSIAENMESGAAAGIMQTYEQTLTLLLQRHQVAFDRARVKGRVALAEAEHHAQDPVRLAVAIDEYESVWRRVGDAQADLVKANSVYAALIRDSLPQPSNEAFWRAVCRMAYPHVYPIRQDLQGIIEAALQATADDKTSHAAIQSIAGTYAQRRDAIARRMMDRIDEFTFEYARTRVSNRRDEEAYWQDLDALALSQTTLAQQTITQLQSVVPPSRWLSLEPMAGEFLDGLARYKPVKSGLVYRP